MKSKQMYQSLVMTNYFIFKYNLGETPYENNDELFELDIPN